MGIKSRVAGPTEVVDNNGPESLSEFDACPPGDATIWPNFRGEGGTLDEYFAARAPKDYREKLSPAGQNSRRIRQFLESDPAPEFYDKEYALTYWLSALESARRPLLKRNPTSDIDSKFLERLRAREADTTEAFATIRKATQSIKIEHQQIIDAAKLIRTPLGVQEPEMRAQKVAIYKALHAQQIAIRELEAIQAPKQEPRAEAAALLTASLLPRLDAVGVNASAAADIIIKSNEYWVTPPCPAVAEKYRDALPTLRNWMYKLADRGRDLERELGLTDS